MNKSENKISIYVSGQLTKKGFLTEVMRIKSVFPDIPVGFYDTLEERLSANNFTDERFRDAVGHLIDNCPYPRPSIADIISYDKSLKLYTHTEVCNLATEGHHWEEFRRLKNELKWIRVSEAQKYGLEHLMRDKIPDE